MLTKYYYYHTFRVFFKACYESSITYGEIIRYLLSIYCGLHIGLMLSVQPMHESDMVPALLELIFHQRRQLLV